jgi:hypothetical protein
MALVVKASALVREDCSAAMKQNMRFVPKSTMNLTDDAQVTDNVGLSFESLGLQRVAPNSVNQIRCPLCVISTPKFAYSCALSMRPSL